MQKTLSPKELSACTNRLRGVFDDILVTSIPNPDNMLSRLGQCLETSVIMQIGAAWVQALQFNAMLKRDAFEFPVTFV